MDRSTPAPAAAPAAPHPRTDPRAVLWMLGAVASFTAMALSVRSLGGALSVYQIQFLRSAVGLPLLVAAVMVLHGREGLRSLRSANLRMHVARNAIHFGSQLGWIYALTVLPFALVFAIEFTTPLWAVVLAALILGEHPTRPQQLGLVLGLAGVLVIVRPGASGLSWDVLVILAAALGFAGTFLCTRVLGRTDQAVAIPFWMCVLQSPPGLALALMDWRPIALDQVPAILVVAAGGLTAHQCMSMALRLAPIARVLPFDYLRLPLIAVIGAAFYAEPFDLFVLLGGAVVLGGVLVSQARPRR